LHVHEEGVIAFSTMDHARPGHTVRFQGLISASHLNGTKGTLVKFLEKHQRWRVLCEFDNKIVGAKPENLIRHIGANPPQDFTSSNIASEQSDINRSIQMVLGRVANSFSGTQIENDNASWSNGLSKKDRYEWFCNCYCLRCDDDYAYGGCYLHGPYNPEASPESVADDFLVYCILAARHGAVPSDWNWRLCVKKSRKYIPYAFEKSDAEKRWNREKYSYLARGARSFRYTGAKIYNYSSDFPTQSEEHARAEKDLNEDKGALWEEVGGKRAWIGLAMDLCESKRFMHEWGY